MIEELPKLVENPARQVAGLTAEVADLKFELAKAKKGFVEFLRPI